ncbi:hypothetical protein EV122DRAFT_281426 [Schizophyllum commune]|nr:uncharacterized protein SCHCODRAFT_02525288 [Schizophyllum commune H4-8]KAI4293740.1 hypothetical protein K525DRAFT_363985 [Schizophyllum commune Loenen D]KAI5828062.1 hypothetical protein K523DRAFT_417911 [Schizophyllum commune Tattone D]KAI5899967.1 hypothetical protein SCHCODRAFT_02525288 [Schizophyllum commune H4-8]
MHPQLSGQKRIDCKELVEALEACEADPYSKWTDKCSNIENLLNKCLIAARNNRSAQNREESKRKKAEFEKAKKDFWES